MNNIKIKIKYIFIPYLRVAAGIILIYAALRWLLDFKLEILNFNQTALDGWISFAFAIILMTIYLDKNILIIFDKNNMYYSPYLIFAAATIFIPMKIAQEYIKAFVSEFHQIENINEISTVNKTDCLKIDNIRVIKQYAGAHSTLSTSGKSPTILHFNNYFTVPIVDDSLNLDQTNHQLWYGVAFKKRISNKASKSEKEKIWREFYDENIKDSEEYNFQDYGCLQVPENSKDKEGYIAAINSRQPDLDESEVIILVPKKTKFEDRFGNKLAWIFASFGIGAFVFLIIILTSTVNETGLENYLDSSSLKTTKNSGKEPI